ncbi:MAG TPA: ethanolamine ammonia-lyase reactivating factor EutA [Alphaproteobacteria bacterium]|nr:ethanolamine ammonia-lyase reactivating factor EutA [Alphaproteobacteria bacterium]
MHDDPLEHSHFGVNDETIFGPVADDGFPSNPDWLRLTSVGIDIGSSTSHLMFSRLVLRRRSQQMSSEFEVVHREVLYRSPILLTPYADPDTIDTAALAAFVTHSYDKAAITAEAVDTGAVICTGEAVRKHNSEAIIRMLAADGGKFVCATAGPNLEAVLGAHGSGAVTRSRDGKPCLHVDIGGGTAKLAVVENGVVVETASVNVGARLLAWDGGNRLLRVEAAGRNVALACGHDLHVGDAISEAQKQDIAARLADILIEVMRRAPLSALAASLIVSGPLKQAVPIEEVSFSGGVSEYIYGLYGREHGDLGPLLGSAIRRRVPALGLPLAGSQERIRATVIGASQYTVQLSSSTVFVSREDLLPLADLQVVPAALPAEGALTADAVEAAITRAFARLDLMPDALERPIAVALTGAVTPSRASIKALSAGIQRALAPIAQFPWAIMLTADVAGLVGAILKEEDKVPQDVIVIDGIKVGEFDFVDLGQPIKSVDAIPAIVKSLVFEG